MELRLFSIEQVPRTLPIWEAILDDLGRPPATRVARALGVGPSTVYRWQQRGHAPRIACLALFWLTRWGRSQIHCQATNDAVLAAQLARSLADERRHAQCQATTALAERDRLRSVLERFHALARESAPGAWADPQNLRAHALQEHLNDALDLLRSAQHTAFPTIPRGPQ